MTGLDKFRDQRLAQFGDDICWALARLLADKGDSYRFELCDHPQSDAVMGMLAEVIEWSRGLRVEAVPCRIKLERQLRDARSDDHFVSLLNTVTKPAPRRKKAR